MNRTRLIISAVVVFIVFQIMEYLVHEVMLKSTYVSLASIWRPEADFQSKFWIMILTSAIWCFLFTYFYAKTCKVGGLMTGVRFGFLIGLFFTIPMSYNWYVILPIPYHLALRWFLFGMGEIIIAGIIVALLYKPLATTEA